MAQHKANIEITPTMIEPGAKAVDAFLFTQDYQAAILSKYAFETLALRVWQAMNPPKAVR